MGQNFLSCDREQVMLLPPSVSEWLPVGHLARFVVEVVGQLDLSGIYGRYRSDGHGRRAHDPAMMTGLLLYNYAVGVMSSRVIERRCGEDLGCRFIAANRVPDHVTISRFRARHAVALSALFGQVLELCWDAGMVKVGVLAIDSTKLAANASLDQNRTLAGLRAEAQRLFEDAAQTDAREDALYGDRRGDELPEELVDPSRRAARIRELLERAERRERQLRDERAEMVARHEEKVAAGTAAGRPPLRELSVEERHELERKQHNVTDPDSGIVRHRGMLMQGYNVQAAVSDGQIILATRVGNISPDGGQLAPTLAAAERSLQQLGVSEPVGLVLADGGYWDGTQITGLPAEGRRVLIPPPERKRGTYAAPTASEMQQAFADPDTQQAYRRRQQIVEPVFAHIKHLRGITRVWRRGKQAAQAEIDLIATTHNLLKLYRNPAPAA